MQRYTRGKKNRPRIKAIEFIFCSSFLQTPPSSSLLWLCSWIHFVSMHRCILLEWIVLGFFVCILSYGWYLEVEASSLPTNCNTLLQRNKRARNTVISVKVVKFWETEFEMEFYFNANRKWRSDSVKLETAQQFHSFCF